MADEENMPNVEAYRITIPYPPPKDNSTMEQAKSAAFDLNDSPETFWRVLDPKLDLGPVNPGGPVVWEGIYPFRQYVNDGLHFMISPKLEGVFATPQNLTAGEIAPAARLVEDFLQDEEGVAGYNIGPEKRSPQSWWNWHIHCEKLTGEPKPLTTVPEVLREPWHEQIEAIIKQEFIRKIDSSEDADQLKKGRIVNPNILRKYGFAPRGGMLIEFDAPPPPEDLAASFKQIDTIYTNIFRGWEEVLNKRDDPSALKDAAEEYCRKWDLNPEVAGYIRYFGRRVMSQNENYYKGPNYSVSLLKRDGRLFVLFNPHLYRKGGSLEALGIEITRQEAGPEVDLDALEQKQENKRLRTVKEVERLKELQRDLVRELPRAA